MKDKSEWSEFELALLASWGKSSWGDCTSGNLLFLISPLQKMSSVKI